MSERPDLKRFYDPRQPPSPMVPSLPWGWIIAGLSVLLVTIGFAYDDSIRDTGVQMTSTVNKTTEAFSRELIVSSRRNLE